jgi:hypothetical protein
VLRSILPDGCCQTLRRFARDHRSSLAGERIDIDASHQKGPRATEQHLRSLIEIVYLDRRRGIRLERSGYPAH